MLLYKGWLETRSRLLFLFGIYLFFFGLVARHIDPPLPNEAVENLFKTLTLFLAIVAVMLAGAGIKAQPPLREAKGMDGSMYFTLSLPVSRLRLLATRAGLGMFETVGFFAATLCVGWLMFSSAPGLHLTAVDLFAYWVTVSICMSSFYFLSVLLATFLDDVWQMAGSIVPILILQWLPKVVRVPASLKIFQAMGTSSPFFTHTFPWASMSLSPGASVILLLAAMKVAQSRNY